MSQDHRELQGNHESASEQQVIRGINDESIDDDDLVGRDTWQRHLSGAR
jgi:hypothetical protein